MEDVPLRGYEVLHAGDLGYVREMVGLIFVPYELELVRPGAQLDAWLRWCQLGGSAVSLGGYGAEVHAEAGPMGTFFAVVVPWSGTAEFRCGYTRLALTPSMAAVLSPMDADLSLRLSANTVMLTYQIEQLALEAQLAGLLGESLREPLRFEPAMLLNRGDLDIGTRLRGLVYSIDRGETPVSIPLVARTTEQELMTSLLFEQPHNYTAALHARVKPVGSRVVRQAVALLESHPEWPHTVESVAKALSVSRRSLQRAFHRELSMTFQGLLHDIRLQRVHDDLLWSAPEVTFVNDVIARWGLPLEGHTFRAYHERFGETPSETLHRFG